MTPPLALRAIIRVKAQARAFVGRRAAVAIIAIACSRYLVIGVEAVCRSLEAGRVAGAAQSAARKLFTATVRFFVIIVIEIYLPPFPKTISLLSKMHIKKIGH